MKEKINYKSKRAIIIGIACVALFALVAIGTVLYIKGNNVTIVILNQIQKAKIKMKKQMRMVKMMKNHQTIMGMTKTQEMVI